MFFWHQVAVAAACPFLCLDIQYWTNNIKWIKIQSNRPPRQRASEFIPGRDRVHRPGQDLSIYSSNFSKQREQRLLLPPLLACSETLTLTDAAPYASYANYNDQTKAILIKPNKTKSLINNNKNDK